MLSQKERDFANLYNSRYCLFTGNATTALYLIIKSLKLKKNSKILLPNSACQHVPISIILAGHKPSFIDVDQKNFGLDLSLIKKNYNKKIKAIIAIHAYGMQCDIKKISTFCKKKKIYLIEDSALYFDLKKIKRKMKFYGNAAVFSFGKGKIIDLGTGGAVLTNSKKTFDYVKMIEQKLPVVSSKIIKKIDFLNSSHTKIYNKYYLNNKIDIMRIKYKKILKKYSKNLLFKLKSKNLFKQDFSQKYINQLINKRLKKFNYLKKKLLTISNNFFRIQMTTGIPWRLNIFFDNQHTRNYILKSFLKKKIKVSSWHPSLDLFFVKRKSILTKSYPISDKISKKILNFWINEEVNKSYFDKIFINLKKKKKEIM